MWPNRNRMVHYQCFDILNKHHKGMECKDLSVQDQIEQFAVNWFKKNIENQTWYSLLTWNKKTNREWITSVSSHAITQSTFRAGNTFWSTSWRSTNIIRHAWANSYLINHPALTIGTALAICTRIACRDIRSWRISHRIISFCDNWWEVKNNLDLPIGWIEQYW